MDTLLEAILEFDRNLLLALHHLSTEKWDTFWILITNPTTWIPLFIMLFFLGKRLFKLKKALYVLVITTLAVLTSLGLMMLIKNYFQRIRPINDVLINNSIRKIVAIDGFSFISGHSMVSFTIATLMYLLFKKYYKSSFLIFLFPILFAYSRVYLAVHYPTDIFFGMFAGIIVGSLFYRIIKKAI